MNNTTLHGMYSLMVQETIGHNLGELYHINPDYTVSGLRKTGFLAKLSFGNRYSMDVLSICKMIYKTFKSSITSQGTLQKLERDLIENFKGSKSNEDLIRSFVSAFIGSDGSKLEMTGYCFRDRTPPKYYKPIEIQCADGVLVLDPYGAITREDYQVKECVQLQFPEIHKKNITPDNEIVIIQKILDVVGPQEKQVLLDIPKYREVYQARKSDTPFSRGK